jgi:signal transduction histidine kinase
LYRSTFNDFPNRKAASMSGAAETPITPTNETSEIAALRRENALLRETLNTIDGTVVVYDANRRYVLGNRAYHEHFPHLPDDSVLAGKLFEEVLALSIAAGAVVEPEAYSNTAAFIARRISEIDRGVTAPREAYDPVRRIWYLIRAKLTPSGARVSLRVDINDQKRLQRELEQAMHAAEAGSRAKSMFLANTSHEFRTPLNAVINFARLIQEQIHGELGSPVYAEYAQSIHESGMHLLALIEDLLDLARAEAGRLTLTERPVNLRAMVASVGRLLEPDAVAAGLRLMVDAPADLPAVEADGTRLRQVLFNLLANAIKFCRRGDLVRVSAARTPDGRLRISVADTGPGIAREELGRVMRPFERAAEQAGREIPGVGLGLPLASHLVSLHGGELTIESTPGVGTTATFLLPAHRVLTRMAAAA